MTGDELARWRALRAMIHYLQGYWGRTRHTADVALVLSDLGNARPGSTADPGAWEDWEQAWARASDEPAPEGEE